MKALSIKNVEVNYYTIKQDSFNKILFKKIKKKKFTALSNISFDIEKGSVIGIIGPNGSGKSTLLRTIANIFSPDKGKINLYGNSVNLLSLGTGFDPELTGYENIFLSGMLLGFSKKTIEDKMKDIIEFSELGEFIYNPVKTYSSGMYSKLAFSIMAILDSDIILIDEILSVGDLHFQEKSYNKIQELIKDKKRTALIVSHSTTHIENLCDKVIWLDHGKIKKTGNTKEIIEEYREFAKSINNK